VLTATVADPTGYVRIVRDPDGVTGSVEHRDAGPEVRAIDEINTAVYAFEADALRSTLPEIGTGNRQGERYLTDAIGILVRSGRLVHAVGADAAEALGVNSHAELAVAAGVLRSRINTAWMESGVAMADPERVYIDAGVRLAPGVEVYPDVHLEGATTVDADAVIGPGVFARDTSIGARSRVWYSVLVDIEAGADVEIGPYAHLRPGTGLDIGAKAGSFVEIKAARVGAGSKVPHLAYVGDATIGEGTNIGAGTITVNYDGFAKHHTVIGDRVRIGSDTMLVAPVEIGDDAYTGAGSVITKDVSPGSLAVERSPQREIPGYAARRQRRADREQP
jgi:bifunctional UDP-N-acetylglucosamine pyrophosphorylase/glucosamine-1-phosphate N-acetyltransferase